MAIMMQRQLTVQIVRWVTGCLLCGALGASAQNTIALKFDSATTTISRSIYGALMENLGRDIYNGIYVGTASTIPNTNGMRNDIIAAMIDGGISCLEWPGGCFAETYLWRNGIGPVASRPGGAMVNGLGTAEYFQLCQLIGSDPYICCDMTADSAGDEKAWLQHIDSTPTWESSLKYWKIGNEVWGGCGAAITSSAYITKFNQFTADIPAANANMWRIMSGSRDSDSGWGWTDTIMKNEYANIQGLSFHYYAVTNWTAMGPSLGFTTAQYYAQLNRAYLLDRLMDSNIVRMDKYDPTRKVGLMIDEWGAWYTAITGMGADYNQSSMRDAEIAVMSLNMFNNRCNRVRMALVAQAVNVIQALFLTPTSTTSTKLIKTPVFYVFKLLKPHQKATMVPITLQCETLQTMPVISASASVDSTGALHISMGNIDVANVQPVTITLTGAPQAYQTVTGQIVNGPTDSSYNDTTGETVNIEPFASGNFTLNGSTLSVNMPAHSVVMMTLTPNATGLLVPGPMQTIPHLSLKAGENGKVMVGYSGKNALPLHLSLLGIDGRALASTRIVMTAGAKNFVWQPQGLSLGDRVYFIRASGAGSTATARLVLAR